MKSKEFQPGGMISVRVGFTWSLSVQVWTRVKVLSTSSPNSLLSIKSQLLEHLVVVRLFNVCFPNFPISHDLSIVTNMSKT